jgi:hypothetical protein
MKTGLNALRRWRAAFGLAAALALVAALLAAPVANAAIGGVDSKVATSSNAYQIGRCNFTVKSANYLAGTVKAALYGQARPKTSAGYTNNAHTAVGCQVYDQSGSLDDQLFLERDGPTVSGNKPLVVPFNFSYTLCEYSVVTLRNGNTYSTPFVCS